MVECRKFYSRYKTKDENLVLQLSFHVKHPMIL